MIGLTKFELYGFKSIRHLSDLKFKQMNVLIGANGAGKSNLISFFKMLAWMTPSPGGLQFFIGKEGGANSILYDGANVTDKIEATLTFETDRGTNEYRMRLFYASPDTLIFADERYRFSDKTFSSTAEWKGLDSGHKESRLINSAEAGDTTARVIRNLMRQCVVYQFHNTSETARVRQKWNKDDCRFLKEDAANLAPFLFRLHEWEPDAYLRIVDTVRQITPFFADFVLEPSANSVMLQWRERDTDMIFGPHQASDGMLRAMALVSLLLQPEKDLPEVLILDEPELGLHPYAINIIAGLIRSVSNHVQVILATQSTALIDQFLAEDIIVVERDDRESKFRRLDFHKLEEWLNEYSVGELWQKNVLGGRPAS